MASSEERKIKIVADGSQVNATFNDMSAAARLLQNQLKKLPPESEEFAKKSEKLKDIKGRMNEVKDSMFGAEKAQKALNSEFMDMIPFGGQIQAIAGKFGQWKGQLGIVSTGFKTLRGAIISTGLGALVVALGLVINYLMNTQDGIDKVQSVLQPLNVIFQRTIGILQKLGGDVLNKLTAAIKNPKQAFIDFADIIKNQVMNRLEAFGMMGKSISKIFSKDWKEGLKELAEGALQATTGVEDVAGKIKSAAKETSKFIGDSVKIGKEMAALTISIEEAENKLLVKRAELNAEYQKQKEIAQDVSKSEEERLKAARKAQDAQNNLLNAEQAIMKEKIRLKFLENDLNDTSRADDKEYQELLAQNIEFEGQAAKKRASAKALENSISKEIHAENIKRLKEEEKAEEENQKKIKKLREEYTKASLESERAMEDLRLALMEDGTAKKIAKLQLQTQRELEVMEEKKNKLLENEVLTMEERQAVIDQWEEMQALKKEEAENERRELEKEQQAKDLQEKLTRLGEEEQMEALLLEEHFINALDREWDQKEKLLEIQRQYAAEKLALLQEAGKGETLEAQKLKNSILKIDREISDGQIEQEKKTQEAKRMLQDQGYSAAKDILSLGLALLDEESQGRKDFITAMKTLEIGRVISDGISEIAAIWKNANANPMNILVPGSGALLAGIQTAAAAARTGMAVSKIKSTKYATGGTTGSGKVVDMLYNRATGNWQMPGGQKAKAVGTFAHGGHVGSASIGVIGEAGAEWVGPNWMMRSPKYANIFRYLEGERVRGHAFAEGGTTAPTAATIPQNSSASADIQQMFAMMEASQEQTEILRMILARVEEWPTVLKVINDPRDTMNALNALNQIEEDSKINR